MPVMCTEKDCCCVSQPGNQSVTRLLRDSKVEGPRLYCSSNVLKCRLSVREGIGFASSLLCSRKRMSGLRHCKRNKGPNAAWKVWYNQFRSCSGSDWRWSHANTTAYRFRLQDALYCLQSLPKNSIGVYSESIASGVLIALIDSVIEKTAWGFVDHVL